MASALDVDDLGFADPQHQVATPRQIYAANLFGASGLALYALYVLGCLAAMLPARVFDPVWLESSIRALIANAMFPVIGSCLLALSGFIHPQQGLGARVFSLFRRWAWIGMLGYLLLIPLQGLSTFKLDRIADAPIAKEINGIKLAEQGVRNAQSMSEIGEAIAKLPGSPTIPQGFDIPVNRFKEQILDTLTANQNKLVQLRQRQTRTRRIRQTVQLLHTGLSCLIIALVFSAAAQPDTAGPSLLQAILWHIPGLG